MGQISNVVGGKIFGILFGKPGWNGQGTITGKRFGSVLSAIATSVRWGGEFGGGVEHDGTNGHEYSEVI